MSRRLTANERHMGRAIEFTDVKTPTFTVNMKLLGESVGEEHRVAIRKLDHLEDSHSFGRLSSRVMLYGVIWGQFFALAARSRQKE